MNRKESSELFLRREVFHPRDFIGEILTNTI